MTLDSDVVRHDACGISVLGAWVSSVISNIDEELSARLARAWHTLWSWKDSLMATGVALRVRFRKLNFVVLPALLWGLDSARLTVRQRERLRATQVSMVWHMRRAPRAAGEGWLDWYKRTRREALGKIVGCTTTWDAVCVYGTESIACAIQRVMSCVFEGRPIWTV